MSIVEDALQVAARAVAYDPRSATSEESIAYAVRAIDEFLASPQIDALNQADADIRAHVLPLLAERVRSLIDGYRNMLSVAAQVEQHSGDSVAWAPALADAIRRLEDVFRGTGDLSRASPPPIVKPDVGSPEQWRVEQSSTPGDESLDDILEDAMDLVRAQHTEAMARVRHEAPLDWETVRRKLDLDRD